MLEYRERQKIQAQEELARRQRASQEVQQELLRLQGEEQRLLNKRRRIREGDLNVWSLISLDEYHCALEEQYRRGVDRLCRKEEEVRQQRGVTLEAWRSCQVLIKLRDKAWLEYREAEKISEQRLNDEMGLNCHFRREETVQKQL